MPRRSYAAMPFFPSQSEVLVSSLHKDEVLANLQAVTKQVNYLDYDFRGEKSHQFNGSITNDQFRLSLVIQKADSFLPLIKGRVEETPKGSILFLTYRLFPSSTFFLRFWSFVCLALVFFFFFVAEKPLYAAGSLVFGLFNYSFAWLHFKRKIKISQDIFHQLLDKNQP